MAVEPVEPKDLESLADSSNYPSERDIDDTTQITLSAPGELVLKKTKHHEENISPRPYTGWRWFLIIVGLLSTCFLYGLDNTIVADIQAAVVVTYGDVGRLSWMGSGFPLGSIAVILFL